MAREHPYARGRGWDAEGGPGSSIPSGRTVGEVAALARVTVRALHHYDEIGLVQPSGRSEAGYRLYDEGDLERLQQVLFYRELGFALDDIGELMASPDFERGAALREQRRLLEEQGERLRAMIEAVDAAIAAHQGGYRMNDQEMFEVFGDFNPREFGAEAEERWGDTVPFKQSRERAKDYRKEDWLRITAEAGAINESFAEALDAGVAATSERAMGLAEDHRQHIVRWFYDCSPELHRNLAEMYIGDDRFAATFEAVRPGLAQYVHDAVVANAAARG